VAEDLHDDAAASQLADGVRLLWDGATEGVLVGDDDDIAFDEPAEEARETLRPALAGLGAGWRKPSIGTPNSASASRCAITDGRSSRATTSPTRRDPRAVPPTIPSPRR
jgi:hypothetical protein